VGQVVKPAADCQSASVLAAARLLCGAANHGCCRLSAGSLRLPARPVSAAEDALEGTPPARLNALRSRPPTRVEMSLETARKRESHDRAATSSRQAYFVTSPNEMAKWQDSRLILNAAWRTRCLLPCTRPCARYFHSRSSIRASAVSIACPSTHNTGDPSCVPLRPK
jgi:hypothetical protein